MKFTRLVTLIEAQIQGLVEPLNLSTCEVRAAAREALMTLEKRWAREDRDTAKFLDDIKKMQNHGTVTAANAEVGD